MKKTFIVTTLISILTTGALAQTRTRYVFDNFDSSGGVTISGPQVKAVTAKPLVKKTVSQRTTMNAGEGMGLKGGVVPTGASGTKMYSGNSMGGFTTGSPEYDSYIVESSMRYGIDPLLIYSQMHQESSFKLRATSNKGASGLMQLMPATAMRFGVTNIYDPRQNIDAGVKYMRWLLDKFNGDVSLALAGYNAGEGAVMKYGYQIPPYNETQEYVRRITARYYSIRNPGVATSTAVKKVTKEQVAKIDNKPSAPLTIYEPTPLVIRTPDGRMRLVNQ